MPRLRGISVDQQAYRVAYLYAEHRLSQTAIAEALNLSPAAVSRALSRARELQCIVESYHFMRPADFSDDAIQSLESALGFRNLASALRSLPTPVRQFRVFDSGRDDDTDEGIQRRQRAFGEAAAGYLVSRLPAAARIGIAWGSTLGYLVDGIARHGYYRSDSRAIQQVVPTSAEPMRYAQSEFTASALARRLDSILNGSIPPGKGGQPSEQEQQRRLALTGVPAFISRDFGPLIGSQKDLSPTERDVLSARLPSLLREFFLQTSPAYGKIFGSREPLVESLDLVLTSAGSSDRALGFCNEELRTVGGLTSSELNRLVVGDLGGVLLPRHNLSKSDKQRVHRLSEMWTGVTYAQMDGLAKRATKSDCPGIVVVAIGHRRSEVVCEILVRGLCNELIVDRELATALEGGLRKRMVGET